MKLSPNYFIRQFTNRSHFLIFYLYKYISNIASIYFFNNNLNNSQLCSHSSSLTRTQALIQAKKDYSNFELNSTSNISKSGLVDSIQLVYISNLVDQNFETSDANIKQQCNSNEHSSMAIKQYSQSQGTHSEENPLDEFHRKDIYFLVFQFQKQSYKTLIISMIKSRSWPFFRKSWKLN